MYEYNYLFIDLIDEQALTIHHVLNWKVDEIIYFREIMALC